MKYPFFLSDYVTWGLPVIAGAWSQRTGEGGGHRQPAMRGPKMLVGDPGANNTSAPKASSSYAAVGWEKRINKRVIGVQAWNQGAWVPFGGV